MMEIKRCVTCMFINNEGKILLLQHKKCKEKLQLPAGTLEPNEISMGIQTGAKLAAVREMKEELDIHIKPRDLVKLSDRYVYYDRIDGHKIYKEVGFLVTTYEGEIKNMEPDKHKRIVWMDPEEIFEHPELYTYGTWSSVVSYMQGKNML